MTEQIEQNAYTQVLVRAATDEAFRAALLSDATGTLRSLGVEIPEGVAIKAVENTDTVFHLILPPKISEEMSDEELDAVSGGYDWPKGMSYGERQTIRERMMKGDEIVWIFTEYGDFYPTLKR